MRNLTTIFALGLLAAMSACEGSDFRSKTSKSGDSATPHEENAVGVDLACPDASGNVQGAVPSKGTYAIKGTLCPKGVGNVDVIFIIDFSQSMQYPADLVAKFGVGSDPVANGSCGRLEAAKKIVELIKQRANGSDNITFTSIPFSDDFVSAQSFSSVSLKDIDAKLTKENFCGTLLYTNYAAGFKAAKDRLNKAADRTPVVYFITDGKPLVAKKDASGNTEVDPVTGFTKVDAAKATSEGSAEATALKAAAPNLKFYSVFLGKQDAGAVAYLKQISGKDENVGFVSNAGDLATEVVKFALPNLGLVEKETSATLDGEPVKIATLSATPSNQNIWQYTTEPVNFKNNSQTFVLKSKTESGNDVGVTAQITAP